MSYKPEDNFKEFIEQFQAKETPIPQEVLDIVKKECGNEIPSAQDIKRILRRNGKPLYIEHANLILRKLYGDRQIQ